VPPPQIYSSPQNNEVQVSDGPFACGMANFNWQLAAFWIPSLNSGRSGSVQTFRRELCVAHPGLSFDKFGEWKRIPKKERKSYPDEFQSSHESRQKPSNLPELNGKV